MKKTSIITTLICLLWIFSLLSCTSLKLEFYISTISEIDDNYGPFGIARKVINYRNPNYDISNESEIPIAPLKNGYNFIGYYSDYNTKYLRFNPEPSYFQTYYEWYEVPQIKSSSHYYAALYFKHISSLDLSTSIINNNISIDMYSGKDETVIIPEYIEGKIITRVNKNSFSNNDSIVNIIIPDSLKQIGQEAFSGCSNLTTVYIGQGTNKISPGAFSNCPSLKKIVVNNENEHFYMQNGLLIAEENKSVIAYESGSHRDLIKVPDDIKSIELKAFSDAKNLTFFETPESLEIINDMAFQGCSALNTFVINKDIISMGSNIFTDCNNLKNIYIEYNKDQLPSSWNSHWLNNDNVNIVWGETNPAKGFKYEIWFTATNSRRENVERYSDDLIRSPDATALISEYVGNMSIVEIPPYIEGAPVVNAYGFKDYLALERVVIPDTVEFISRTAFLGCSNLDYVILPDSVELIRLMAFANCSNLTHIELSKNLKKIEATAFANCIRLESIYIPNTVNEMGFNVFDNCRSLRDIYCEAKERPENWSRKWADGCYANIHWGERPPIKDNLSTLMSIF